MSHNKKDELLENYKKKIAKKVSKLNCQVLQNEIEKAELFLKDLEEGQISTVRRTWWQVTEEEFKKPVDDIVVRITDHQEENYDWYKNEMDSDTYFLYTNTNRRVLKVGE